jgi:hypothetical protein
VLPSPVISIHPVQPVPLFATCHKKCTTIVHHQAIKFDIVQDTENRLHSFSNLNKIVNGVPHDAVHILYKGILYFQNVTHFQRTGINVFSIMAIRKVSPSLR